MSKHLPYSLAGRILMCGCVALMLSGCGKTSADSKQKGGGKGGRGGGPTTIPVAVAKAEVRDLPVLLTGLGSVEAFNTVAVKSRIDGQLVQVPVKEGQEVTQG
ncbi:MAG TPA: biotin/lipoyl-binding protein, partial [Verrucomicrobiae bacterium]|nr:biotin/lipoyl-binding protein [Verrucomicrobiae bacterium]